MISTIPLRLFLVTALSVVGISFGNVPASAITYATPSGLKSTAHSASTVDLTWNAVTSAPRYRIQQATNSAMSGATYFRVTANKRQMTGLKPSTKYFFKVRVITSDGVNLSPYSSAIAVTTSAAPPSEFPMTAPTGLKSTELASTMASLSWNAKSGAQKYRIQLSTNADMSGATYFRFVDARAQIGGLKAATKYFFKVRVITVDGVNQSPYSGSISATTKAATAPALTSPFNFTAKQKSTSEIVATWSAIAGASKFQVQRSESADMAAPNLTTVEGTSATLTGLSANTTYFLRVRAVTGTGAVQGNFSPIVSAKTAGTSTTPPLKVASYNVRCANCLTPSGSRPSAELSWSGRRAAVVSTIVGQKPDVIGVQEASQAWLKDSSGNQIDLSQFEDLRNRLQAAGANYRLANSARNNCVKSTTPTNCTYKYQGASKGNKIFYNADTVEMLRQGSKRLESACSSCNERYVAWAVLRQKSSGKEFFFATMHLEPTTGYYTKRNLQIQQASAEITARNTDNAPIFAVGDLNTTRYSTPSNFPYDTMIGRGLVDPLGHTYMSAKVSSAATAETRIHANYNSFNGFIRTPTSYGANENGNNIDYIFTPPMRVTEWETVVSLDFSGKFAGTIPSDHNMLRATVLFP